MPTHPPGGSRVLGCEPEGRDDGEGHQVVFDCRDPTPPLGHVEPRSIASNTITSEKFVPSTCHA
jgi:hypothetical protein